MLSGALIPTLGLFFGGMTNAFISVAVNVCIQLIFKHYYLNIVMTFHVCYQLLLIKDEVAWSEIISLHKYHIVPSLNYDHLAHIRHLNSNFIKVNILKSRNSTYHFRELLNYTHPITII